MPCAIEQADDRAALALTGQALDKRALPWLAARREDLARARLGGRAHAEVPATGVVRAEAR
ncbi:hypothetical protein WMF37_21645 [Sorangium sp. So ce291]|uniref:hypothetical protein n=1 Tax=Sorangium sp. So ce291 TaxID=3133294 RepID=UPI003F6428EF